MYTFQAAVQSRDEAAIIDLLWAVKDELYLPDRAACAAITTKLFACGGIVLAYDGDLLCGLMGYFLGDPNEHFADRQVAFMYVAGILPTHRLTRVFHSGLIFSLKVMAARGATHIRLQAEATNPYTNRLYGRFADKIGEGKSLRGKPVNTYGGTIAAALAYLERRNRPVANSYRQPTPHAHYASLS